MQVIYCTLKQHRNALLQNTPSLSHTLWVVSKRFCHSVIGQIGQALTVMGDTYDLLLLQLIHKTFHTAKHYKYTFSFL